MFLWEQSRLPSTYNMPCNVANVSHDAFSPNSFIENHIRKKWKKQKMAINCLALLVALSFHLKCSAMIEVRHIYFRLMFHSALTYSRLGRRTSPFFIPLDA